MRALDEGEPQRGALLSSPSRASTSRARVAAATLASAALLALARAVASAWTVRANADVVSRRPVVRSADSRMKRAILWDAACCSSGDGGLAGSMGLRGGVRPPCLCC